MKNLNGPRLRHGLDVALANVPGQEKIKYTVIDIVDWTPDVVRNLIASSYAAYQEATDGNFTNSVIHAVAGWLLVILGLVLSMKVVGFLIFPVWLVQAVALVLGLVFGNALTDNLRFKTWWANWWTPLPGLLSVVAMSFCFRLAVALVWTLVGGLLATVFTIAVVLAVIYLGFRGIAHLKQVGFFDDF